MYFVLNKSCARNHYSCILCDDYLFGDIITIDRRKINIVKKLSDDEIYDILSIVYRNLKLRNNETLYNKVYLKVRDYKENV